MKRPPLLPLRHWVLLATVLLSVFACAVFAADINCDIQRGPCIQNTGSGMTVEFDIRPKPVTAMSDLIFTIIVTRHGKPAADSTAALDLTMPGMYMGKNWPVLKRASAGRFEGKGIIPTCPTGKKTWKADVIVAHEVKTVVTSFVFEVK